MTFYDKKNRYFQFNDKKILNEQVAKTYTTVQCYMLCQCTAVSEKDTFMLVAIMDNK